MAPKQRQGFASFFLVVTGWLESNSARLHFTIFLFIIYVSPFFALFSFHARTHTPNTPLHLTPTPQHSYSLTRTDTYTCCIRHTYIFIAFAIRRRRTRFLKARKIKLSLVDRLYYRGNTGHDGGRPWFLLFDALFFLEDIVSFVYLLLILLYALSFIEFIYSCH